MHGLYHCGTFCNQRVRSRGCGIARTYEREDAALIKDDRAGTVDFEDCGSRPNLSWIEFAAAVGGFLPGALDGLLAGEFGFGEAAFGKNCFARGVLRDLEGVVTNVYVYTLCPAGIREIHPAAHHLADGGDFAFDENSFAGIIVWVSEQGGDRDRVLEGEGFAQFEFGGG